ncbi:argininosuccinate lyase [bacterium]|nr:argininosuccinate lyase [bacterium]
MSLPPSSQPKSAPVWAKRVGDASLAEENLRFTAGYDVAGRPAADARLAPYDLQTNGAHLLMLTAQGIVPAERAKPLAGALLAIRDRVIAGEEILRASAEDIHMSVEVIASELVGDGASGHLHTGRSRNDQVATDMRLWLRDEIVAAVEDLAVAAEAIADHAALHTTTVCPGFTHGQPAMVTSWGHWTMSYLPRLLRDVRALAVLLRDLSTCPLGAAASFGTSWPLDRNATASLLGFAHPTPSGADGIWARGEMEGRFAFALSMTLGHLSGIAQDIILLSSPPRQWLHLANEHVTGSSIMPQKRNPDFAEVTRARAAVAAGLAQSLLGIGHGLMSGYNRDTQWTKYLVMDAADNARGAASLFAGVFGAMRVNGDAMLASCREGFLNATDVADHLARTRSLPFRTCYRIIGPAVADCEAEGELKLDKLNARLVGEGIAPLNEQEWAALENPAGLLMARRQPGNPHPEETLRSIELLRGEIREEVAAVRAKQEKWQGSIAIMWTKLAELAGKS